MGGQQVLTTVSRLWAGAASTDPPLVLQDGAGTGTSTRAHQAFSGRVRPFPAAGQLLSSAWPGGRRGEEGKEVGLWHEGSEDLVQISCLPPTYKVWPLCSCVETSWALPP